MHVSVLSGTGWLFLAHGLINTCSRKLWPVQNLSIPSDRAPSRIKMIWIVNSCRKGDLEVMMTKYGSLHQFLLHLHDNGRVPVSSFWWGKTHVVTLCSPQAFKESVVFVNRPRELITLQ